ncbi:hypothetical protein HG264_04260 [Pseudomonas sp. gcc21]|uniref:hypothetical protein n=1 Tax=Pseudomonas sp. gcc21 TaxID=2726989 RepID=UPI0014510C48|nr:hypothetical protein [Pseudomonas sp. gcc21]QJD58185.1 hypothetical protein HG264_04260 [Pseudomonas sp. gcc21]
MSNTAQLAHDAALGAAKASPGIVVAATGATGAVDWSSIAYATTALYMVLQIVLLVPKYREMIRGWGKK